MNEDEAQQEELDKFMERLVARLNNLDHGLAAELIRNAGHPPRRDSEGRVISKDDRGGEHHLIWPAEEPDFSEAELHELNEEPADPELAAQIRTHYAKHGKPWERTTKRKP
jgi:hypothetical protein